MIGTSVMKELKELLCQGLTEKSWKYIRQFSVKLYFRSSLHLEGLVQVALRKAPVIAPFVNHFKVAITRGSHGQTILTVLWKFPLKLHFHSSFSLRGLSLGSSAKSIGHCSFSLHTITCFHDKNFCIHFCKFLYSFGDNIFLVRMAWQWLLEIRN